MFKSLISLLNSNPIINRFKKFFSLPDCYFRILKIKDCKKSRLGIILDLLELFFGYKTFPDHYGPCRLWEVQKSQWKYYYGSNYQIYQQIKLTSTVQPSKYRILFNDKAVCDLLCRGIGINNLPRTYGMISPDLNYKELIKLWFQNNNIDSLIIKPLRGTLGRGIVLAKRINNNIIIQSKTGFTPLQDFDLSETAIVQVVIKQHKRMSAFSSSSVNTIRVMTLYTKKGSVLVLGALMRSGIGESYVDNWDAGGVAVGIENETGQLKKYGYNKEGIRYIEHPTSKVMFEGFIIPQWQCIVDLAVNIQKAFPWYRLLGMDIALRENGEPILIEINSKPDFRILEQTCGPLLQVEKNLIAFGEYDLFVNKHQKALYNMRE